MFSSRRVITADQCLSSIFPITTQRGSSVTRADLDQRRVMPQRLHLLKINTVLALVPGAFSSVEGPEAGVWVIAETRDLGTRYAKIVVTDERGHYVVPDLPKASYMVWARGYELADSEKTAATPGQSIDLSVTLARDAAAAAKTYPAAYWYAMMKLPDADEVAHLPGKRNEYLMWMKNMACVGCDQCSRRATDRQRWHVGGADPTLRSADGRSPHVYLGSNPARGGYRRFGRAHVHRDH